MKSNKNLRISGLLTLLLGACYTPGVHAAYDDVGVGARVTGMGNAFTALADDVYAIYYNPAGLGTQDRPQLATTYSKLFTGLTDNSNLQNSFLAYEHPIDNGRQGALGLAWDYFTLDSLYREMSLSTSYGRRIFAEQFPHGLYAGATLKYLSRSLGNTGVADNAYTNTGQQLGDSDPVLKKGSRSNFDADLGLLWRFKPRFTAGFSVQHLLEPNIAFSDSDTDRLGRNVRLGAAYQTPWTSFTGDVDFLKAPNGQTDKVATVGVEKWLPTLVHGTFGLRGSVGVGDRQYRQITVGMSYRINRMQLDYGFNIPLGTVSGTFGNHRMGLSFLFGRPIGAQPRVSEAILENMRELADVTAPEYRSQAESLALYKRTAQREFLRQAQVDTSEGRFDDARLKLDQALGLNPQDKRVQESLDALTKVAAVFPEVKDFRTDPAQAALYEGVLDFLALRSKDAVRKLTYAQSLQPGDERYEKLLQVVEQASGLTRELPAAPAAPTLGREKQVAATLALMEVALREGRHDQVIRLADEVLSMDPQNVLALKRKAASHYARKEYEPALKALRAARKAERDPDARRTLDSYIEALVALMNRRQAAQAQPAQAEAASPEAARPASQPPSPVEIQKMYEAGVDLFAQGRLSEAATMFQQILKLDPKNASATKALRRVQAELLEGKP